MERVGILLNNSSSLCVDRRLNGRTTLRKTMIQVFLSAADGFHHLKNSQD
jgi:hypothetical protein